MENDLLDIWRIRDPNNKKFTWRQKNEREYDYNVRGSIIRSRATWFEQGERNSKYFLNLEYNNNRNSCFKKQLFKKMEKSAQTPTPF